MIGAVADSLDPSDGRREQLADLRVHVQKTRAAWQRYDDTMAALPCLLHEVHELRHTVAEIGFLEEHLSDVGEAGKRLVNRLVRAADGPERGQPLAD